MSWRSSQQSNLPMANQSRSKIFEIKHCNVKFATGNNIYFTVAVFIELSTSEKKERNGMQMHEKMLVYSSIKQTHVTKCTNKYY